MMMVPERVQAVAQDASATLWLGLQNHGLRVRPAGMDTFEPQAWEALEGVGILAIVTAGDRVVAGTSGRGVAIGRYGGELVIVSEGLENPTVTAVLLDPDNPGEMLVGTWSGIYHALPPPRRLWLVVLGAGLGVLLLTGAMAAVYRSTTVQAALAVYRLSRVDPGELYDHLNRRMAQGRLRSCWPPLP